MKSYISIKSLLYLLFILFIASGLTAVSGLYKLKNEARAAYSKKITYSQEVTQEDKILFLEEKNRQTNKTLQEIEDQAQTYTMWLIVLTLCGVFAALWSNHQIYSFLLTPLNKISSLTNRATNGELNLRIPRQKNAVLNVLGTSINRIIEKLLIIEAEINITRQRERTHTLALIEVLKNPTIILDSTDTLVMANSSARAILTGQGGNNFIKRLVNAVESETTTIDFGGIHYKISSSVDKRHTSHIITFYRVKEQD